MEAIAKYRDGLGRLLEVAPGDLRTEELAALLRELSLEPCLTAVADSVVFEAARGYGRTQLFASGRWEVALVVLQSGQTIRAHDHGEYEDEGEVGLVFVVEGVETNRFYRLGGTTELTEIGSQTLSPGESLKLDAEMIHSVTNEGTRRAVSLHAYIYAQGDPATKKRRY